MPGPQRFQYDPNKPVEGQLQAFLGGRPVNGTATGWNDITNTNYYRQVQSNPDEGGNYTTSYESTDPNLQVHNGSNSPVQVYGRYAAPNMADTSINSGIPGGASGYLKPDNMYDYNNLYYDPKYGLLRDSADYRDPTAKNSNWIDAAIMSAVGGAGFGAAGAAEGAAGGSTVMGQTIPRLASTGLNTVRTADNILNPGSSSSGGLSQLGGNMAVTGSPYGIPAAAAIGALGNTPAASTAGSPGTGTPTAGNSGTDDGSDLWGVLGNLLTTGATGYTNNRNNQNYKGDINNMLNIGTGGVQTSDRAGARNLVTGVYNGSISPDQVLDRVPGLRAVSDRGQADIARHWAARGDSDPNSSAAMRDFVNYNNELTTKAYGSEMDRAASIGGFGINPSAMAGQGLRALGDIYGNNRQDLSSLASILSGANGKGTSTQGILAALAKGGSSAANALRQIFSGVPSAGGMFDGGPGSMTGPSGDESNGLNMNSGYDGNDPNFYGPNMPSPDNYDPQFGGVNYLPPTDYDIDPSSWGMA